MLQISDCHLVADGSLIGVDTEESLKAVLDQALESFEPDALVATGDLAHDPYPQVYERFLNVLQTAYSGPTLCLPGNHDVLDSMVAAGLPLETLELGNWALIPLDSHEDEKTPASVRESDRQDFAQAAQACRAPNLLAFTHHPMVEVNCPWLDRDMIQNGSELVSWLSECSAADNGEARLRGVAFGHAHQIVEATCGSLPVWGAPSTCFQFLPESQAFAVDTLPPGARRLDLDDDGSIMTRVVRADYDIVVTRGQGPGS